MFLFELFDVFNSHFVPGLEFLIFNVLNGDVPVQSVYFFYLLELYLLLVPQILNCYGKLSREIVVSVRGNKGEVSHASLLIMCNLRFELRSNLDHKVFLSILDLEMTHL